jgi:hypothetical protein
MSISHHLIGMRTSLVGQTLNGNNIRLILEKASEKSGAF